MRERTASSDSSSITFHMRYGVCVPYRSSEPRSMSRVVGRPSRKGVEDIAMRCVDILSKSVFPLTTAIVVFITTYTLLGTH